MPVHFSKGELVKLLGAKATLGSVEITFSGTQFDSRLLKGGELFVALKGEGANPRHGHEFIGAALIKGASLCLVEDERLLSGVDSPDRMICVDDTLIAFQKLANLWRKKLKFPVVAVTGSVGKTTTKELAACILSARSKGAFARKSFNNHIGVPYSICDASLDDSWMILEMGMNHPGELDVLSKIAEPNAAAITRIAPVHMFAFKDLDGVADAKCEIFNGMESGGTAILNGDDDVLLNGAKRSKTIPKKIQYFGLSENCNARVESIASKGFDGIEFTLNYNGSKESYALPILGKHNAHNAACAILLCRAAFPDLSYSEISAALNKFEPPPMRLNIRTLKNGAKLVDDSYNSNPEALKAVLDIAADLQSERCRVGIFVGDMLELGEDAKQHHSIAAERVAAIKPEFVVAVGEFAELFANAANKSRIVGIASKSPEEAAKEILKLSFDLLFVKASRGIGLDRAVKIILEK